MKLGIVLNRVNFEEKQIIKACDAHGVQAVQFNNQNMSLSLTHQKDLEPQVDVFLQRSLSHTRSFYTTAILESKGYKILNNYYCVSMCGDKLHSSLLLGEAGVPTPKTYVAFSPDEALKTTNEKIKYPVICKPVIGSWGRMVAKLNDSDAATAIYEARDNLGDIFQQVLYMQEFIDTTKVRKDAPTDIRAFWLGDRIIAAMGRYHPPEDFRSNIAIGGSAKPYEITDKLQQFCKKVATAFKGEILGIDLMETENGWTCIEVNGTPGFQGITECTGINIGEKIVDYLKTKYG